MAGNSFANCAKMTPCHNAFVQKILESGCHIISTIRTKSDYTLTDKNGKMVPEKVGLKGIQRDGIDFEFTIVFDLDIKHNAVASKDRTGLFMDKPEGIITPEYGKRILQWCNAGVGIDEVIRQIRTATSVEQLRDIYHRYPEYRTKIENLAVARKQEINANIINQTKIGDNGTETR